jgi:hypothetical protein
LRSSCTAWRHYAASGFARDNGCVCAWRQATPSRGAQRAVQCQQHHAVQGPACSTSACASASNIRLWPGAQSCTAQSCTQESVHHSSEHLTCNRAVLRAVTCCFRLAPMCTSVPCCQRALSARQRPVPSPYLGLHTSVHLQRFVRQRVRQTVLLTACPVEVQESASRMATDVHLKPTRWSALLASCAALLMILGPISGSNAAVEVRPCTVSCDLTLYLPWHPDIKNVTSSCASDNMIACERECC